MPPAQRTKVVRDDGLIAAPAPGPAPAAPAGVRRMLAAWLRLESAVAIGGLGVAAALLTLDILARELLGPLARATGVSVLGQLPPGLSRYALYGILVSAFAGFAVASATGFHLGSGLGGVPVPRWLERHRDRLGDLLTALVFAAFTWYAARFVLASFESGARASFLSWPAWPIQAAMPLAFGASAVRFGCFAAWPALRPARRVAFG